MVGVVVVVVVCDVVVLELFAEGLPAANVVTLAPKQSTIDNTTAANFFFISFVLQNLMIRIFHPLNTNSILPPPLKNLSM